MRILHLPNSVGGHAPALAEGETALGAEARSLALTMSPYRYRCDIELGLQDRGRVGRLARRAAAFLSVRDRYDVFHFNFGSSLLHFPGRGLPLADLPFYPARAVKIVTWQGCDARQKYPTMDRAQALGMPAACLSDRCYGGICNSGDRDRRRRRAIDKAARHADHMFALNPDLLRFLPPDRSSFLPYAIRPLGDAPPASEKPATPVRIAHAPTDRAAKGTDHVVRAVRHVQGTTDTAVELDLIEGVPNDEARRRIAAAHILVDQLLIGWYGGVAVEAMTAGVPVVCYLNPTDLHAIPDAMRTDLPVQSADAATLARVLAGLVQDADKRRTLGERSRAFAAQWHAPAAVAARTLAVYRQAAAGKSGNRTAA